MPLLRPADHPSFHIAGTRFTSLAAPSRGAVETAAWRLHVAPGTVGTPHRVTQEEVIVALSGKAQAVVDGQELVVAAVDSLIVPASSTFALGNPFHDAFDAIAVFPVGGEVIVGDAAPFTPPWAR